MNVNLNTIKVYTIILFLYLSCAGTSAVAMAPKEHSPVQKQYVDRGSWIELIADQVLSYFDGGDKCHTLEEKNAYCQKTFLRPKGAERLSKESEQYYVQLFSHLSDHQKQEIWNLLKSFFIESVNPKSQ